jgi:hypothetical protein
MKNTNKLLGNLTYLMLSVALPCFVSSECHAAPAPIGQISTNQASARKEPFLEAIKIAAEIRIASATLRSAPSDATAKSFLQYAIDSREAYGYGKAPSAELLRFRTALRANPGKIFDFMMRWEQEADDCSGAATVALYATYAEILPSYNPLRQLIDIKLSDFAKNTDLSKAFGTIKCSATRGVRSHEESNLLALTFLTIRYILDASEPRSPLKTRTTDVINKISDPELKNLAVQLGRKIRPSTPVIQ